MPKVTELRIGQVGVKFRGMIALFSTVAGGKLALRGFFPTLATYQEPLWESPPERLLSGWVETYLDVIVEHAVLVMYLLRRRKALHWQSPQTA